jgi:anti-sigma factor RsiW
MGAHALGALPADQAAALEAHLAICPSCQNEAQSYQAIREGMLHAAGERVPSSRVRAKLLAVLAEERRMGASPRRFSFAMASAMAGLVLALGLSAGLMTQVVGLQRQMNGLGEQLRINQTALALVAYPGARSLPVFGENAGGTMVVDSDQPLGVLIAWGLPILDASHTYQVWMISPDGTRTSGGLFTVSPAMPYASVVIQAEAPMSAYRGLGVTIEPAGGSPAPTGARVLRADF